MSHEGEGEQTYHPKDTLGLTLKSTAMTGTAGAFISTIQNTLARQNVGAFGIFTRTGGTIAVFAAMGGAYEFSKNAAANLREKDDTWNSTIGGFFAGSMIGLRARSLPAIIGYGTGLAVVLATFNYTGGQLRHGAKNPDVDEVARKEYLRKAKRRPIEETINELGEGRGIYGPGYEQRRAERIKERYGIDVPIASAS